MSVDLFKSFSNRWLQQSIARWRTELSKPLGAPQALRVLIMTEDDAQALAVIVAANLSGCTVYYLSARYGNDVLKNRLSRWQPDVVFGDEQFRGICQGRNLTFLSLENDRELPESNGEIQANEWVSISVTVDEPLLSGGQFVKTFTSAFIEDEIIDVDVYKQASAGDTFVVASVSPFSQKLIAYYVALTRSFKLVLFNGESEDLFQALDSRSNAMEFGIFFFGSYKASEEKIYDTLIEISKYADALNFASLWTPERHFNEFGGLFPNPALMSAALASMTQSIQVRSGSLVSPIHDTLRIAEDYAVVDNLSSGRLAVSFASGWQCDDFVFFPERYEKRDQVMLEQIEEVRSLWAGRSVTRQNGLGKPVDVKIFPKPIQKNLPVWITVSGKLETFQNAGKYGTNILTHLLWQNKEELIEKIQAYRQALRENGFNPKDFKVTVMVHTYMAETMEEVNRVVRNHLKNYIKSSIFLIEKMVSSTKQAEEKYRQVVGRYGSVVEEIPEDQMNELLEISVDRFINEAGLFGNVNRVLKVIRMLKGYDVDEVACLVDFGPSKTEILKSMELLNILKNKCVDQLHDIPDKSFFQLHKAAVLQILDSPMQQQMLNTFRNGIVMTESLNGENVSDLKYPTLQIDSEKGITMIHPTHGQEWLKMMMSDLSSEN
jgi:natural product biosynthesis luciferase-like monooxygenase protein